MKVREMLAAIDAERGKGYELWLAAAGYDILFKRGARDGVRFVIRCRRCKLISHNPHDVENRYCGNCHVFHERG
jgi:hypothetical protein